MDKLDLRQEILRQIEEPRIPAREYSALDFGIVPDSPAIQTEAINAAIRAVSREGGGRLMLPAGRYRTGAIKLETGVDLNLSDPGTVLAFVNEDIKEHYPVVFSHWEATPCCNFSPLIYACDACDIAVTGAGTLDGGADKEHWWDWHHQVENAWSKDLPDLQQEDRLRLRQMNAQGVPVEERRFGPGHFLRPNFIQFIRCRRVLVQGITIKNSPMWQLNPVMCGSLTVDRVRFDSHGPNNDGCDPESCDGVYIRGCRFDTGDDCISLKSGRDRDGRLADMPCRNVLIEENEFADGHGGIALGSEMSGGIFRVAALNNRFSSPHLTYALRFKTNARRGGRVEDIFLADSVMEHVHGAAVHGTMLYEDGRSGDFLPVFSNITIENIWAHGGDYGIFLEAFEEVPVTGLVLRDIVIDGVDRPMRAMNWKEPVIERVMINGEEYPRPSRVRILGITAAGKEAEGSADDGLGGKMEDFFWEISEDGREWKEAGRGKRFRVPEGAVLVRAACADGRGNWVRGRAYRVLSGPIAEGGIEYERQRLECRGMLEIGGAFVPDRAVTRRELARMLAPLAKAGTEPEAGGRAGAADTAEDGQRALRLAVEKGFLDAGPGGVLSPEGHISRQEMATVAMQACGVSYRNASSTMPVCLDAGQVANNYGTNAARALYFGFMELEEGRFHPRRLVTAGEAAVILNRAADFAGI